MKVGVSSPYLIPRAAIVDPELTVRAPAKVSAYAGIDALVHAARSGMAYGSLVAGMAFGATGTHLCHAIQYPIGALTHTPHGLGTGLILPYVLEVCAAAVPDRVADLGVALGVTGDVATVSERTVERVAEINRNIGVPTTLAETGITRVDLPRIAELALLSK